MSEAVVDITTSNREMIVTRIFDAPREMVWNAMTDPQQIVQWWGPKGFTTTIEEHELRPGGTWKHTMRGPDGTEYPNKSVFKEVVKPERIVYAHSGTKKGGPGVNFEMSWTLETVEGNKTKLTLRQIYDSTEERDKVIKVYGALEGAKQHFQCLSDHLAKVPFVIERTFDASADMVWKAITDAGQMKEWYFTNLKSFKAEVGFETQVDVCHDGKTYPHLWKVIEVVPGRKLAYSWKYKGHVGDSLVTFELFSEGKKTRIKLTHEGLETFLPDTHPMYARSNFVMGWNSLIGTSLKEFVEDIAPFADRDFVISREFEAPRELMWKTWTDPKHLVKWWGPRHFTNPVCEMDFRVGGAYRIVMRSPDGSQYPCVGVFREIVEPERLVMIVDCSENPESWHDLVNPHRDKSKKAVLDFLQMVTFEKNGTGTKLTIRIRFETAALREALLKVGMTHGWSESLDKLAEHIVQI